MSQSGIVAVRGAVLLLAAVAAPALAYMGPGAGLSAIGSLLALIAAAVAGLFGFIWFPVKRLLRRRKAVPDAVSATEPGSPASQ